MLYPWILNREFCLRPIVNIVVILGNFSRVEILYNKQHSIMEHLRFSGKRFLLTNLYIPNTRASANGGRLGEGTRCPQMRLTSEYFGKIYAYFVKFYKDLPYFILL